MQPRLCIHMVLHVKFEAWNKEITNLSIQSNDGHLKPFSISLFHGANNGITGLLGSEVALFQYYNYYLRQAPSIYVVLSQQWICTFAGGFVTGFQLLSNVAL